MRKRVLVVEDSEEWRGLLKNMLTAAGMDVVAVGDGVRALDMFAQFQPDLVLSDVALPNMDGVEVCRRVKETPHGPLIPVMLITGVGTEDDRSRGVEAGADDYLSKRIKAETLLARTRQLLRKKSLVDEMERIEAVLEALVRALDGRDPNTEGHCNRVAAWSVRLGQRMGMSGDELVSIRRAASVHDIGKVAVPDAVLLKPGRLTAAERAVMQIHPVVGERICSPLRVFRVAATIVRHHHEKLDGSGYPDGLKGEEIPLAVRVVQIVDVFDALVNMRPYRNRLSHSEALQLMKEEVMRGWWDAMVFERFREMTQHWQHAGQVAGAAEKTSGRERACSGS
jgi:putative two-component system response regulator